MHTPNHYIGRKALASLLHSARTAEAIGRPLNTYVTINAWQMDIGLDTVSAKFQHLRSRHFQKWASYQPRRSLNPKNGVPTYAWVIEAPEKMAHIHWMIHIRPLAAAEFEKKLAKWLKHMTDGVETTPENLCIKPIWDAEGLKKYLAKGAEPYLAQRWNIEPKDSGIVFGPRAGTSRNLGPSEWQPRKAAYIRMKKAA